MPESTPTFEYQGAAASLSAIISMRHQNTEAEAAFYLSPESRVCSLQEQINKLMLVVAVMADQLPPEAQAKVAKELGCKPFNPKEQENDHQP